MKNWMTVVFCALILIMTMSADTWAQRPAKKISAKRVEFEQKAHDAIWAGTTDRGGFMPYADAPKDFPRSREELETEKQAAMEERERLHAEWAISKTLPSSPQEEDHSKPEREEVEPRELPTQDNYAELKMGDEEERYSPQSGILPERNGDEIPKEGSHGVVFASWYGEDFHGDTMADGEPFDMYAISMAQKTWPINTIANFRVVGSDHWIKNVPKTDWGPNEASRDVDVSREVAIELGFFKEGTTWLEYEIVYVPPQP
ncbi:MAG: septal ring lytic transglycosylase RlpA family protein [Patescibacteria group bacterium]